MNGYTSFSHDVLAKHASTYRIFGYRFDGYFASIDSMANYFKYNVEMLDKEKRDALFLKDSPIFTKNRDSAPTRYKSGAVVENSFIADGCVIEGTVRGCIFFRGVHVAKGAVVENSILMQDTYVSSGSELGYVITDKNVVIKEKRKLHGCESLPFYIGKNSIL